MYTNKTAFDKASEYLLATTAGQSKRANTDFCLYRGPNGNKCAIGALIPDDMYDPKMDEYGGPIDCLRDRFPQIRDLFKDVNIQMLDDLQELHDDYRSWDDNGTFNAFGQEKLKKIGETVY